jgi:hypothetical protein
VGQWIIHFPLSVGFEINANRNGAQRIGHSNWPSPPGIGETPILADVQIRHPRRDVGPCRDGANLQLFLTDEEQFANPQLWKSIYGSCREELWHGTVNGWSCSSNPH